jgi:acyl-CoA thioester hydrolase
MSDTGEITRRDGRPAVEISFRVRYYETDSMGVVHHAFYITWFEEGRSAFTRAIGYPYARMEAEGVLLALTDVAARYHRSARYDEEVVVTTFLDHVSSRGLKFSYEVRRAGDAELLATGRTSLISVDRAGSVIRLPDAVRQAYGQFGRAIPT